MAQLYYRYGTMNSGKTVRFKVAYNYEGNERKRCCHYDSEYTRDGVGCNVEVGVA